MKNLEKIVPSKHQLKEIYSRLKASNIEEVVILSTCNRFEVYYSEETQKNKIIEILTEYNKELPSFWKDFYYLNGYEAFKHLLFVILGFDSMLSVEEDIVQQVKNSYSLSNSFLQLNKPIHVIFQHCIYFSRYIKNKYNFAPFRFSLVNCVLEMALKVFSTLNKKNVLILGTGIISRAIINKIYDKVKSISVYSYHQERVNKLIVELNRNINKVSTLDNLENFDIIIGATNTSSYLISKEQLGKVKKDIIVIFDLGLPRNISPDCAMLKNVFLFTLDDVYSFHHILFSQKESEYQKIKQQIEEETYQMWNKIIIETDSIDWLNIKETIKNEVVKNLNNHLASGTDEKVINKIAHNILKNLKKQLIKCKLLLEQEEVN